MLHARRVDDVARITESETQTETGQRVRGREIGRERERGETNQSAGAEFRSPPEKGYIIIG